MGCGGAKCGQVPCRCHHRFTVLSPTEFTRTFARNLTPCVDAVRDLATCLGTRPYQVLMIKTRWTGGERGVGLEELVSETYVLPTPKVDNLNAVNTVLENIGSQEQGSFSISRVSARYTEDELCGREPGGIDIGADENFYWEVRLLQPDGLGPRRRFIINAAPHLDLINNQWIVRLIRVVADRERVGEIHH